MGANLFAILLFAIIGGVSYRMVENAVEGDEFLVKTFSRALALRFLCATFLVIGGGQDFFGSDWLLYDTTGTEIANAWRENRDIPEYYVERYLRTNVPGWGMHYWVGMIYFITGPNSLLVAYLHAIVGSIVPLVVFQIAEIVFRNRTVSERAAILTAYFPSLILWSSQVLKDPIILLCLVTVVYAVVDIRRRFTMRAAMMILVGLFIIYALRFYVAYILALAIIASFLMGSVQSVTAFVRQLMAMGIVGGVLLITGAGGAASETLTTIDLKEIQFRRNALATTAASGFGADLDVSTPGGALGAIPIGLTFLLLAPFPWQMTSLRSMITLPEMLLWYSMIPLLISGIRYSLRYRLSETSPMMVFSLGLCLAYSIFLGNVGTAYRQRAQILVFFFLFIAVGHTLRKIKEGNLKPPAPAARS
jgi:hypothetical protein